MQALAQACTEEKISDEIKRQIAQHVNQLARQYSSEMTPVLASLPSDQQTALSNFAA